MIDLDELAARSIGPRHQECAVGFALRIMDPDLAAKFRKALANPAVRRGELVGAFSEYGHDVPGDTITRHRDLPDHRRECKCLDDA